MNIDPRRFSILQASAAQAERAVQAAIEALNKASYELSEGRRMGYGPAKLKALERAHALAAGSLESARDLRDGAQANASAARRALGIERF